VNRYRPLRILLVEDNPDDVAITERAFAKSDVASKLDIARDGQEALERLTPDASGELLIPDLVLLDVNLPKVSGLDVLARLRERADISMIPVVMLTASARREDVLASYMRGANSYIQKPVIFERFTRALEVLGIYWFEVATLPSPQEGEG
jgi:two-component system response regulator